jgi:hypothetical protein
VRSCLGTKFINHILRTVFPTNVGDFCLEIKRQLLTYMKEMLGEDLNMTQEQIIHSASRYGGLGLLDPLDISYAAFLAATCGRPLPKDIQRQRDEVETAYFNILRTLSVRIPEGKEKQMSQHEYAELLHMAKYNDIIAVLLETNVQRTKFVSQTVRGASSWHMFPEFEKRYGGTCTIITNDEARVLLMRHLNMDIFEEASRCPMYGSTTRTRCKDGVLDHKGEHAEKCKTIFNRRHEDIARAFRLYVRDKGIDTRREQSAQEAHDFVADLNQEKNYRPGDVVSTIRIDGRFAEVWMDFAIVSEMTNNFSAKQSGMRRTVKEEKTKLRRYRKIRFGNSARFHPTVASTSGAWGPEANKAFQLIANYIAEGELTSVNFELKSLRQFLSTMIVKRVAGDIRMMQMEIRH